MFKQIIIATILILICLCTASCDIVYKARFANHTVCIDDSINNNHGTYYNTEFDTGVRNGAVVFFEESEGYIRIENVDELSFTDLTGDLPFSLSFWVLISDTTIPSPVIKKGYAPGDTEYTVTTIGDDQHGSITLYDSTTGYSISCRSEQCLCEYNLTNDWMFVVITYDGSASHLGLNMYFNGLPISTVKEGHPSYTRMRNNGGHVYIGRDRVDSNFIYTSGRLDEVILYDYELSEHHALQKYNEYKMNEYSISFIDKDLISIDKNISIYENDIFIKTIVYGESITMNNTFDYSFVLHEDSFDRFSHIENLADTSTNGITYIVYAFVLVGIIALLMFMYRRF